MSADLQPLRDWLAAHPTPEERIAEWGGGEAGQRENGTPAMTLPYPDYTPTIVAFWAALEAAGWREVDTSDYMAVTDRWSGTNQIGQVMPKHLAAMDRATLLNFLRSIERSERFCDGTWVSHFENGFLHAAAVALTAAER